MKIKLPIILRADDYHEFSNISDALNSVLIHESNKEAVKFQEIGYLNGDYHAIFFDSAKSVNDLDIANCLANDYVKKYKTIKSIHENVDFESMDEELSNNVLDILNEKFPQKPKKNKIK